MNRYEHIEQTKESYRQQLPGPKATWPPKVRRALAFIIVHLFDPRLTVGWMKEQCRINGHNFSSRFAWYLGKTPKQYILHHRMAVAKLILSNDALKGISISDIPYEIGIEKISTFSKSFKRETGISPSQWQRKHTDN